jgi:hypothetical protein
MHSQEPLIQVKGIMRYQDAASAATFCRTDFGMVVTTLPSGRQAIRLSASALY